MKYREPTIRTDGVLSTPRHLHEAEVCCECPFWDEEPPEQKKAREVLEARRNAESLKLYGITEDDFDQEIARVNGVVLPDKELLGRLGACVLRRDIDKELCARGAQSANIFCAWVHANESACRLLRPMERLIANREGMV
jgi:hypothetical protein